MHFHFGTGLVGMFCSQVTSIVYTLKSLFWAMALLMLIIFVFSVLSLGTALPRCALDTSHFKSQVDMGHSSIPPPCVFGRHIVSGNASS